MNCPHCGKELPPEPTKPDGRIHVLFLEYVGGCGYLAAGGNIRLGATETFKYQPHPFIS